MVGVIHDVKTNGLNAPAPDEIYYPLRQLPRPGTAIVARTDGDPAALQAVLRSTVAAVDNDLSAKASQFDGDRLPETGRGARDQSLHSFECAVLGHGRDSSPLRRC